MIAVVDTNIVVAAFLTRRTDSPVSRIVDAMLEGKFRYLLSPVLLREYRTVLLRNSIQKRHGLTEDQVDVVLKELAFLGIVRTPEIPVQAPDPGDDHLWALLKTQTGSILVTGDDELLRYPPEFASVVPPDTFCQLIGV